VQLCWGCWACSVLGVQCAGRAVCWVRSVAWVRRAGGAVGAMCAARAGTGTRMWTLWRAHQCSLLFQLSPAPSVSMCALAVALCAGNWSTDIAGGSKFGYTLLCVILGASMAAMFLQHLSLKLGVASDRDLAQVCGGQLGAVRSGGSARLAPAATEVLGAMGGRALAQSVT
jgi:hypothetical protein